jgi:hypothetical protein
MAFKICVQLENEIDCNDELQPEIISLDARSERISTANFFGRPEFPSHHRVFENLRGRVQSFFPSPCFFRLSTRSPKDAWRSLDADLGIDPEQDDASERDRKYEQQMRLLRVKSFEDVCIPPRMRARLARTVNGSPVCPVFPVSRLTRLPTISFCLVPFFLQLYRHCKIRSRYSSSIYYYKDGVKKIEGVTRAVMFRSIESRNDVDR